MKVSLYTETKYDAWYYKKYIRLSARIETLLHVLEFTVMIFFLLPASLRSYLKHTKVKQSELILWRKKICCPIQETRELIRRSIYHAV